MKQMFREFILNVRPTSSQKQYLCLIRKKKERKLNIREEILIALETLGPRQISYSSYILLRDSK